MPGRPRRRAAALAALTLPAALAPTVSARADAPAPGTVLASAPLPAKLWVPGTTAKAFRLTYQTTDAHGRPARSTGEVFIPKGTAPAGGWPVISWAHGTSGLGDSCAPSLAGPALPERDLPYLATWMKQGYAIVASDYAGLGTPGLPAYLNGRSTAHNIVDMVKAGRGFAARKLSVRERLSRDWAVIGQSQGAGAAIYTARYATRFGGPELRYRGAVGTGTPAYIEKIVDLVGPQFPPSLGPGTTAYLAYIFAALRSVHPELGINGILTATGRKYLAMAETTCVDDFENDLKGVSVTSFFTKPVMTLPRFTAVAQDYLAMPESGFDKPFFMGHGLLDTDVPYVLTAPYVAVLLGNHQPLTFKTYPSDHSGTLIKSQADTVPFVARLFGHR